MVSSTAPGRERLLRWLNRWNTVLRAAASATAFQSQAAACLADLLPLDRALVLLRKGPAWEIVGRDVRRPRPGPEVDSAVVRAVFDAGRTELRVRPAGGSSLNRVEEEAILACPIHDPRSRVVGVVYASRTGTTDNGVALIDALDVPFVEMLASALGATLTRQALEEEVMTLRGRVRQFKHERGGRVQPPGTERQERDVTVLFCDICGFSRQAERLGASVTGRLLTDVMEQVTGCVAAAEGSVVDYYGDGLLAMWNAPEDQPDHASRACRAALAIAAGVPALSARWHEVVGGPLQLGIALNTGPALVGNSGSTRQFKYGPVGHTVNVAHRVESVVKHVGIPVLLTESVKALLGDAFPTRRLGRVRLTGIHGAVDLYELYVGEMTAEWLRRRDAFEEGLAHFEAGRWPACCRSLYPLLAGQEGRYDNACLNLATRALSCIQSPPEHFDPVVEFPAR